MSEPLTSGQISKSMESVRRELNANNIPLEVLVVFVLKDLRVTIPNYDSWERQVRSHIIQMNPSLA